MTKKLIYNLEEWNAYKAINSGMHTYTNEDEIILKGPTSYPCYVDISVHAFYRHHSFFYMPEARSLRQKDFLNHNPGIIANPFQPFESTANTFGPIIFKKDEDAQPE